MYMFVELFTFDIRTYFSFSSSVFTPAQLVFSSEYTCVSQFDTFVGIIYIFVPLGPGLFVM